MSVAAIASISGCGDELSQRELAEFERLTQRLSALCTRKGPLEPQGKPAARRARQMVMRMMELTKKAPNQHWVIDPASDSDSTTTPADQLQYVGSDILGASPDGRKPPCSSFLSGRVEQRLIDMGHINAY